MNWKHTLAAIPLAVGLGLGASQALAAACKITTINPTPIAGSPGDVDTLDMTLVGSAPPADNSADDCAALYDGNEDTTEVNSIASQLLWGNDFELAAKSDGTSNTVEGIDWSVTESDTGTFLLTFTDSGTTETLDLIGVLKQGNFYAVFFFDDVTFTTDGQSTGTYLVDWCTSANPPGGRFSCSTTDLSHLSIYIGEGEGDIIIETPEPVTLLLLGIGLAGLGLTQRRRRRSI